jgi:hypothetical protein
MADVSDDAYLLEVMASHATLAFRPDTPKVDCRCKCEEKVDALTGVFNDLIAELGKDENHVNPQVTQGGALAFGAGVTVGAVIAFLIRRKRI